MAWKTTGPSRTATRDHRNRKARVFKRDGNQCQIRWAGCTGTAEVLDHIDNTRGPHYETDDNTQAACAHCNNAKAQLEATTGKRTRAARGRYDPGTHPGLRPPTPHPPRRR